MSLRAVRGLDSHRLAGAIDMGDRSIHRLNSLLSYLIDLDRCFLNAFDSVVRHHFRTFLESVSEVLAARGRGLVTA